jgi:hypothetical protein
LDIAAAGYRRAAEILDKLGTTTEGRAAAAEVIRTQLIQTAIAQGVPPGILQQSSEALDSGVEETLRRVEEALQRGEISDREFANIAAVGSFCLGSIMAESEMLDDKRLVMSLMSSLFFMDGFSLKALLNAEGLSDRFAEALYNKLDSDPILDFDSPSVPSPKLGETFVVATVRALRELNLVDLGQPSKAFSDVAEPNAVARWVDRDRSQCPTAESFLRRHYGPRLGIGGDLTLSEVGRHDMPLLTALNREFKGRRDELHQLLPTVRERADQRLLAKYGYVPQGRDRMSKLAMLSREKKPSPSH